MKFANSVQYNIDPFAPRWARFHDHLRIGTGRVMLGFLYHLSMPACTPNVYCRTYSIQMKPWLQSAQVCQIRKVWSIVSSGGAREVGQDLRRSGTVMLSATIIMKNTISISQFLNIGDAVARIDPCCKASIRAILRLAHRGRRGRSRASGSRVAGRGRRHILQIMVTAPMTPSSRNVRVREYGPARLG